MCRRSAATSRSRRPGSSSELRAARRLLYVRQALADRLVPLTPSFGTEVDEGTGHFVLASGLRRFDQYESGFAARLGLGIAARYTMQIGLDVIAEQVEQRSREVSDLLTGFDGIRLVGGRDSRGIVSFVHTSRDLFDIRARLAADGVNVWVNTPVGTLVRIAEHTLPSGARVTSLRHDGRRARPAPRGPRRGSDLSTVRPVPSPLSLEWFGCTTFRVRVAGLTLWFDTYLDRPASIPDVGLTSGQVDNADFAFIAHAHYDHMLGADTVAANAGATIVGSYETTRVLRENKVPAAQLLPVSGGETIDCGHDVRVRVFPSLHSCLFAKSNPDSGAECLGDLGVSHQERAARVAALFEALPSMAPELRALPPVDRRSQLTRRRRTAQLPDRDPGWIDPRERESSGCWTGVLGGLRPDVAVLALAGRPNVDGEPHQGTLAQFLVREVELVQPQKVVFCHHDELMPPLFPGVDTGEAIASLARDVSYARYVALPYSEPVSILR